MVIGIALEPRVVFEFIQSAHEAHEFLSVDPFDALTATGVYNLAGDESEGEEQTVSVLVVLIFAGDEGQHEFKARLVELEAGDGAGETVDGSADDLD